jgi:3-dehydroquinate synthase
MRLGSLIKVNLGSRSYPIHIRRGLLRDSARVFGSSTKAKKVAFLSNRVIFGIYGRMVMKNLERSGKKACLILIPEGEKNKDQRTLFFILRKMAAFGLRRDDALVALGGGVIGDLGGLAASLYMRGIDFIQCPTTLLAQVDASIGGKTAVDFFGAKNLLGSFHQPRAVLIDPSILTSLPIRHFRTGLAEIIKYGVIWAPWIFSTFESNLDGILRKDPAILDRLIEASCRIKAKVVSADEREGGKRAWLNYGHTLGHALEAHFKYQVLTHGEAIAYGMWFAALLSTRLGLCEKSLVERHVRLFKRVGLLRPIPRFDPEKVLEKLSMDKKARSTGVHFILTRKIGLVTIRKNLPAGLLPSALAQFQEEIQSNS